MRTAAPRWLFDLTVKGKVTFSTLETDTGVVQIDALTLDEADSIRRASAFHSDLVTRAASETRVLRELGAGIIVGDIPPLAFAVGGAAGIPSIGLGNFTWDWIYADYPRVRLAPSLLPAIRDRVFEGVDGAAAADVGRVREFSNVKDIPFIARHATQTREQVCKALKLPTRQADRPRVVRRLRPARASRPTRWRSSRSTRCVTTANLPLGRTRKEMPHRRAQGLVRQPQRRGDVRHGRALRGPGGRRGSGRHQARLRHHLGSDRQRRGHALHLARPLPRIRRARRRRCRSTVRNAFIGQDDLFAGKWESHIDKLLAQPKIKKKPETNGADVAAEILLKALDKPPKKPRGRPKAKV